MLKLLIYDIYARYIVSISISSDQAYMCHALTTGTCRRTAFLPPGYGADPLETNKRRIDTLMKHNESRPLFWNSTSSCRPDHYPPFLFKVPVKGMKAHLLRLISLYKWSPVSSRGVSCHGKAGSDDTSGHVAGKN
ncbi:putative thioesterase gloN [Fusarium oxysporum f. sp. albedinis]|nr:putative thioesterase gloN [Fusarium oxysporum f. sp. albedinis]